MLSFPNPETRLSETLHYRFAQPDEIPDIARLIAHSFPGPARTAASWDETLGRPLFGGGPETLLVGHEHGQLVAALQLHRFRQWIGGEALPIAGVGTVTISPTHRKRRLATELVTAALRMARERGDVASALYPFRTTFYQKLGYGQAGQALQYQVPPETLPDSPERMRVELLDSDAARAQALAFYNAWARTQTGQLERTERLWTHLCTTHDKALVGYRAQNGALEGYALVTYRADLPPQQRYLEVDELVWISSDARRGLYGWLASLGDQWRQILVRALPSQHMHDWLREPRLPLGAAPLWGLWTPTATLLMGPMFRLIDLRAAWERRHVAIAAPLTVALEIVDAQISENAGSWRLALGDGRVAVDREQKAELTLRMDVSTLSRLYIGSLSPSAALQAGLLECDRTELLHTLGTVLALPEPWTFDRY